MSSSCNVATTTSTTFSPSSKSTSSSSSSSPSTVIDIPSTAPAVETSTDDHRNCSAIKTTAFVEDHNCTYPEQHICIENINGSSCVSGGAAITSTTTTAAAVAVSTAAVVTYSSSELLDVSDEKKYKADHDRCCPPPMFVIMISLLEIGVFVYDYMTVDAAQPELNSPIPADSVLIYRPDRRQEIWRFISYMVLHANWFHLGFNIVVQMLFGLPLEMVHGSARVAIIYLAGVFAGSLGTSVVDSEVYLVGASGGVYALLAAHLANIMLNFGAMKYGISKLASVLIFVSCDLGYAFYTQYLSSNEINSAPSVSYIAHLTGALAGLTIGLLVLKNFEHKTHENLVWWLALGVYTAFTIFAIVFNLINTVTAQILEEEGEVMKQHLLHDLGVS